MRSSRYLKRAFRVACSHRSRRSISAASRLVGRSHWGLGWSRDRLPLNDWSFLPPAKVTFGLRFFSQSPSATSPIASSSMHDRVLLGLVAQAALLSWLFAASAESGNFEALGRLCPVMSRPGCSAAKPLEISEPCRSDDPGIEGQ